MRTYLHHHQLDLLCLSILTLTIPLFFYKLGQSSLVNWDEAWYASISRTIAQSGNLLNLKWNGLPYIDHPPFGFWLEALVFKISGVSEFGARFPQAIAGLLSVYFTFYLGKELFNRLVGTVSAIALSSSFWFVYRARSGNLDILLTLLFLVSIYLMLKASKDKKYFPHLSVSLVCLFLTKTLVPFAIIPVSIVIFWHKKIDKKSWKYLISALFLICAWFTYQAITYPQFLQNFTSVGLRGVGIKTDYLANFKLTKDYLYQGIGKWFWPGIGGLLISFVLVQKRLFIPATFFITFLLPFIFSPKVQIWHLIPIHPILILLFFGGVYSFFEKFAYSKRYLFFAIVMIVSSYFYINQIRQVWYQVIDIPKYISDEAILSKEASKYPEPLLTDGDFDPAAVFYSGKKVSKIKRDDINSIFEKKDSFLLITNDWRLTEAKINPESYKLIKKDRDKVLILHQ